VLRNAVGQAIEVQLSAVRRYGELQQRISSGEWDQQWVNWQFLEYVRDEGAHYCQRLIDIGVSYQRYVSELNREFSERFYARLNDTAVGSAHAPQAEVAEEPVKPIRMDLSGVLGTEAVGAFAVHNRRDQTAQVSFGLGDITGDEGRLPYRMLAIEPEGLALEPGERKQILVRVALIQGLFRAGRTYSANVSVHGPERFDLVITIRAIAPTGRAPRRAAAGPERRPAAPPGSLAVTRLLDEAVHRTGLDDFGDPTFQDGLTRLIESAAGQADLNQAGWQTLAAECRQALTNRLRVTDWWRKHPELGAGAAQADFIVGLPRTGTTLLSRLLAQDQGTRSLRRWEAIDSVPPPEAGGGQDDPRCAGYRSVLDLVYARDPAFRAIHYESRDDPAEDSILLAQHFAAPSVTYCVPDYNAWVSGSDLIAAYGFHRQVLQVLQSRFPCRWLLRSPMHSLALDSLYGAYPDARFVMIHRDPLTVTASMLSLARSALAVFSDSSHARYVADYWPQTLATMAERIVAFRKRHEHAAFLDVSYEDFIADPLGIVQRLYSFLGKEFAPATERRMTSFLALHPPGRYGRHAYRLSDFDVNPGWVQEQFREYCSRFSPPAQVAAPS